MMNIILFALALIVSKVIFILFRNARYWKQHGIVHVPPFKLFKMMLGWIRSKKQLSLLLDETFYKPYPNQVCVGMFARSVGFLIIRDPRLVQAIMTTDFPYFTDRIKYNQNEKFDPLAEDLNNLTGSKWKKIRSKLLPVFSPNKLKQMFPLIENCISELDEYLLIKIQKDNNIELKELIDTFLTNVSFKLAFGIKYNNIKDLSSKFEELKHSIRNSLNRIALVGLLKAISPNTVSALKLKIHSQQVEDLMINLVEECRQNRDSHKKKDFLQLLIDIQEQEDNKNIDENTRFSDTILITSIKNYLENSIENITNTIIYCIYELALNQEIQNKLQDEITSTISTQPSEQKLTYEIVHTLPYLELVLKEILRKYPIIPFTARTCTKDYIIPGTNTVLEKGTEVFIPIYSFHNDPAYFPQPQKFDPDRFLNWDKDNPTYIPFGNGSRSCIAMRMAKTMTKFILISLLQNYIFVPTDKTETSIPFKGKNITLAPKNGIYLKIISRSHHTTILG